MPSVGQYAIRVLPWPAQNNTASSVLRNTTPVCHRANMGHNAYLIICILPLQHYHGVHDFQPTMHLNLLSAELCPDLLGELTVLPETQDPLARFGENDSQDREGTLRDGREMEGGKEKEGSGKG